ncbi:MAG: aldehyde dehydrogenase family protein [Spongiibacteraceae bacterium]|nr:aldehyde dehydrogenase family protein [Spongiibacteraceae bacterium]
MSHYTMLINGQMVSTSDSFDVLNPADESVLAQAPEASDADLNAAVAAAKAAFVSWGQSPIEQRQQAMLKISDIIKENSEELIALLIAEQGKSQIQAEREVVQMGSAGAAARAGMLIKPEILEENDECRIELDYRPLGVVAAIVPWNFPFGIAVGKLTCAIMAGCTLVLKPSPFTPLSTLRLGELIKDVLPKGVLNIITGSDSLGPKLTAHKDIAKISFTGSTATGKKVMQTAAVDLKRITLELGGNDAAIVLDDADIDKMAYPLFLGAFGNSGQICTAVKRVYAHESIYDKLVDALAFIASQVKVGPGSDPESQLGPIQNRAQYEKVLAVLADVKNGEGRIVAGGEEHQGKGYFLKPTIVADVKEGCRLVDEETFGPILPVIKYTDVDDAISRANDTLYGLGGSVWGSDIERASKYARQLSSGSAWVNRHPNLSAFIPFAGAKNSGIGVENHELGIKEYCQIHVVNISKK